MSDDLRERLDYAVKSALSDLGITGPRQHRANYISNAALSVLTEGIEIVTPHREGCEGEWSLVAKSIRFSGDESIRFVCDELEEDGSWGCPAEARIPEALLVSLVEAMEGSR